MYFAPHFTTLLLLVFTPFLAHNISRMKKKKRRMKKNEALLPSEKEESQTLVRTLISLQMHTISQAISHSTTGESKCEPKFKHVPTCVLSLETIKA
jgi:hypothetical protein